jgi:transcriptional regulator with XRE-family HTH domain
MPTFGELLRRLRGSRPQREVAADLKMPVTTLSSLENQDTVPRGLVLKRIADYYGVSLTYFYQSATSEMKPSQSAREWLHSLRQDTMAIAKDTIATYAPPDYPDDVKTRFAERIRQKRHAAAPHCE